jgi:hypothetical protein
MLSSIYKYILYLVIPSGVLLTLYGVYARVIFEDTRPYVWILAAIALLFFYETVVMWFIESKSKTITARQSLNLFLGFKVGKILLSLLFIIIYAIIVKVELKNFVGAFLVIYFTYLLADTLYWLSREKKNKRKYKLKEIEKVSNYYKDSKTKEYHLKELEIFSKHYR